MPKERRDRSVSLDRSRVSPFPCNSSCSRQSLPKNSRENEETLKEWEDARCPVCIEHPHNAILLLCSAHDKGCRPYMCDTSYRHSNCFDQFKKSFSDSPISTQEETTAPNATNISQENIIDLEVERSEEGPTSTPTENLEKNLDKSKLVCPLCRGQINGWIVVEPARLFMNVKSRSCASETCDFTGTYTDLRKHARLVHPLVKPSEADPERQRDWRRLERQRDLGDLLSTLQSSIGEEISEDGTLFFNDGNLLTIYFLVRVIRRPVVVGGGSRRSSWSGTSRARGQMTVRRRPSTRHWGESYDEESRDDNNEVSDGGSGSRVVFERNRRRPTSDDDES